MSKEFELIVFDWDGTLMDSEARIVNCMKIAIDELSLPERTDNELRNVIGLGLREALLTLYPDGTDDMFNPLIESYRQHFMHTNNTPTELFQGAAEMLKFLVERGHYLAVATGKGRFGLDQAMAEAGISELFHVTRCADETLSKPHPQMLEEIMDFIGASPETTLMVGDTEYDLQMARNAKVSSLAVSYGVHEKERLLACGPLDCVGNMQELHGWLVHNIDVNGQTKNGTEA